MKGTTMTNEKVKYYGIIIQNDCGDKTAFVYEHNDVHSEDWYFGICQMVQTIYSDSLAPFDPTSLIKFDLMSEEYFQTKRDEWDVLKLYDCLDEVNLLQDIKHEIMNDVLAKTLKFETLSNTLLSALENVVLLVETSDFTDDNDNNMSRSGVFQDMKLVIKQAKGEL